MTEPLRVVVFASGSGSNFESLAVHGSPAGLWRVEGLVVNRTGVGAMARARKLGIPAAVVPTAGRPERTVAEDMLRSLRESRADVVCLAGYLSLVPACVVHSYRGRMLNVHPSLLPDFGGRGMYGLNVHRAVIASGVGVTGATVHEVTEEYDRGRIVVSRETSVLPGDTPESLSGRVIELEHVLYPIAVERVCRRLRTKAAERPVGRDREPGFSDAKIGSHRRRRSAPRLRSVRGPSVRNRNGLADHGAG